MRLEYNFFDVDRAYTVPKRGKALISEPFLNDSYFKRSIVLLTEHSEDGAVGFVLNKPVNLSINEVIKDFPRMNVPISIGGPVNTNTVHYIHTHGDIIPNSVHVTGSIYWGGDFEVVKELIALNGIRENEIKFFLGYSGWMSNQLESELSRNSWVVTDIDGDSIMNSSESGIWKNMLNKLGDKYSLWSEFPENPQYN